MKLYNKSSRFAVGQGYSNGRSRFVSRPLDCEGRTSSASQKSILYTEVFI